MAYGLTTITENSGETLIKNINRPNRDLNSYKALVMVYGTFGGGTVTLTVSPDAGTTFITLKDQNGTAISFTSAGYANVEINGFPQLNTTPLQVYANISGATSPSVKVALFDNQ